MTKKEMILLESCIRVALMAIVNKDNQAIDDIDAVIHNVCHNVFGKEAKDIEELNSIKKDLKFNIRKELIDLLNKIIDCKKSFDGYMII